MLSAFQRHLHSSLGEPGLLDLRDRAQNWIGPLTYAWGSRAEADGYLPLFDALTNAITALDRKDLRPAHVRLRPTTDGEIPLGVICKLARAFVETLAAGDKAAERDALESSRGRRACAGTGRLRTGLSRRAGGAAHRGWGL